MFAEPMRRRAVPRTLLTVVAVVACLGGVRCGGGNSATGPTPPPNNPPGDPSPPPGTTPPPATTFTFVGAGDIAVCDALEPARQTGQLVQSIGGTVFTLGDNAYFSGTAKEYRECYDPAWGRAKSFTRPVAGNHEYDGGSAGVPYFDYFGGNAYSGGPGPGAGYYSFDFGAPPIWHVIALNSNLATSDSSAQGVWLRNDLAANRTRCTLAYWHHPLFTSAQNGPQTFTRPFWVQLYNAGADLILGGHDHIYEVFLPQDPDGRLDPNRGIREFVVGTGGAPLYQFVTRGPNSQRQIRAFGVLKLTLSAETYEWQFVQVGGTVGDSGFGQCH